MYTFSLLFLLISLSFSLTLSLSPSPSFIFFSPYYCHIFVMFSAFLSGYQKYVFLIWSYESSESNMFSNVNLILCFVFLPFFHVLYNNKTNIVHRTLSNVTETVWVKYDVAKNIKVLVTFFLTLAEEIVTSVGYSFKTLSLLVPVNSKSSEEISELMVCCFSKTSICYIVSDIFECVFFPTLRYLSIFRHTVFLHTHTHAHTILNTEETDLFLAISECSNRDKFYIIHWC